MFYLVLESSFLKLVVIDLCATCRGERDVTEQLAEFDAACRDYAEKWQTIDRTLYELVERNPDHSAWASVAAKVWIIGRTYATGIERKIPTRNTQGSSLSQLTEHILARRRTVEPIFRELAKVTEPLTLSKLKTIVVAHGRFVKLLQPIMRRQQSPRSFASKYMHFHCPAVPLYDTYAVGTLRHLYHWREDFEVFDLPTGADEHYAWHVMRFWQLYQDARRAGKQVSVKLLDYYLLWLAED